MGRLLLIAATLLGFSLLARRETVQPGGAQQGGAAPTPPVPVAPYLTLRAGAVLVRAFAETTGVRVVTSRGSTSNTKTYANAMQANAGALASVDAEAAKNSAVEGQLVRSDRTTTFIVSKAADGWVYTTGDGWVGEGASRLSTLRDALLDASKVPQAHGVASS